MDFNRHEGGSLQPRALQAFNKALALLDPGDDDDEDLRRVLLTRKGVLHTTMGEPLEAIAAFNAAIEAFGGNGELYHHLGLAYSMASVDYLPEAIEALRNAIRMGNIESYEPLVGAHTERNDLNQEQWNQLIAEMHESSEAGESLYVHFALSKALHNVHRYDEAFQHMRRANEIQLAKNPLIGHKEQVMQAVAQIQTIFTRDFLQAYENKRRSSRAPVFIIVSSRASAIEVKLAQSCEP